MMSAQHTLAVLAAVWLAGCSNETITDLVYYERPGVPALFQYAAGGRDFRTVIHGNPSAASKEAFDAAVVAAMQGRNWAPATNFTTSPSQSAREGYRVVLVFSGDRYFPRKALCRDVDSAAVTPATGRVQLQAAFCFREQIFSEVHTNFDAIRGLNDPVLDRAVAQTVLQLFPLRDPYIERDNEQNVIIPIIPP